MTKYSPVESKSSEAVMEEGIFEVGRIGSEDHGKCLLGRKEVKKSSLNWTICSNTRDTAKEIVNI